MQSTRKKDDDRKEWKKGKPLFRKENIIIASSTLKSRSTWLSEEQRKTELVAMRKWIKDDNNRMILTSRIS